MAGDSTKGCVMRELGYDIAAAALMLAAAALFYALLYMALS
jgi:hypothetical protein